MYFLPGRNRQTPSRVPRLQHAVILLWICCISALVGIVGGCGTRTSYVPGEAPRLDSGTSSSWWDASKQELHVPTVDKLPNAEDFMKERVGLQNDPLPTATKAAKPTWKWPNLDISFLVWIMGIVLAIVAVVILVLVLRKPAIDIIRSKNVSENRLQREAVKIRDLPFELEVSEEGFLATAQQHAGRGDFNLAIVYLFSYLLVELDHQHYISLRRGKTNRMYLRELRSHPNCVEPFRIVMVNFERAFFGRHELDQAAYVSSLKAANHIASIAEASKSAESSSSPFPATAAPLMGLLLLLSCVGCSSLPTEEYGESSSTSGGDASLAGFTAFRSLFEITGRRSTTTTSLTPRLDRFGTIVWTPDSFLPPDAKQAAWIDDWLKRNPNSTFIYVGRDYSPGYDYWQGAAKNAAPNHAVAYLREASFSVSKYDAEFVTQTSMAESFGRWFVQAPARGAFLKAKSIASGNFNPAVELSVRTQLIPITTFDEEKLKSEHGLQLVEHIDAEVEAIAERWFEERNSEWYYDEEEYDESEYYKEYDESQLQPTEEPTAPAEVNRKLPTIEELAEQRYDEMVDSEESDKQSKPSTKSNVLDDDKQQLALQRYKQLSFKPLITLENNSPFAYQIEDSAWPGSKLIVVTNASLFCNYALADENRRKASMDLISLTRDQGRVAFISHSNPLLQYSRSSSNDPFGLKLFLIYPLNVILSHALIFGVVTLIALWPIFGRPRRSADPTNSDLGKHVSAFGQLLLRTRDRQFALKNIGRYFREVRRDSQSRWANPEQVPSGSAPMVTGSTAKHNS